MRDHTVKSVAAIVKFLFGIGLVLDNSCVSCILHRFDGSVDEGYCPSSYHLLLILGRRFATALSRAQETEKTDEAHKEQLLLKENSVPHSQGVVSQRDQYEALAVAIMRAWFQQKVTLMIRDFSSLTRDVHQESGKEGSTC